MYLLSRKIKALGFKVVMSGEGADEIFGGYLYFHKAPNAAEFHRCSLHVHHAFTFLLSHASVYDNPHLFPLAMPGKMLYACSCQA